MAFVPSIPIRSIGDVRKLEERPLKDTLGINSTYELFVRSAERFGEKTALRFLRTADPDGETFAWSYRQLLEGIHQTANLLNDLGIGPDDTVSILLPACLDYHLALWGGEAAGIVNPLNPLLSVEKLADLMNASRTKVLIAYGDGGENGLWNKALAARERVQTLATTLRVAPPDASAPEPGELPRGGLDFNAARADCPAGRLVSGRKFQPDDIAAYFHTGGTTGSPKLAKHTHGNQVFTAWASMSLQGMRPQDKVINGYPLFHVAGVLPGSLAALSAGAETIIPTTQLMRNPDIIQNYWKLVERHRVTVVSGVPTVLAALARVPLDGADISSVGFCRTGAAPLPPELSERFETLFGLHVHESLGMTETAGITSITPPGVVGPAGCVGFPVPFSRIRIARIDGSGQPTGEDMPAGEPGLVLIKAPNVFPGYLNEKATAEAFTGDGWLISGDIGFLDDQGRLHLTGRAKDLIIRGGHNIDPKMIEDALDAHPAVDLCAAVGAPDPYAGELPVAFVTLKSGATADVQELLEFASSHVDERPARPKTVTILDAMPQTNVGKIFKPELRRLATEAALRRRLDELIAELGDPVQADITAVMDPSGAIRSDVTAKTSADAATVITTELGKFPVPVTVNVSS